MYFLPLVKPFELFVHSQGEVVRSSKLYTGIRWPCSWQISTPQIPTTSGIGILDFSYIHYLIWKIKIFQFSEVYQQKKTSFLFSIYLSFVTALKCSEKCFQLVVLYYAQCFYTTLLEKHLGFCRVELWFTVYPCSLRLHFLR